MIEIVLRAAFSGVLRIRRRVGRSWDAPARDGKIKAPTTVWRMWLVALGILGMGAIAPAGACRKSLCDFNCSIAIARV